MKTEELIARVRARISCALDSMPPGGREEFLRCDNDIALLNLTRDRLESHRRAAKKLLREVNGITVAFPCIREEIGNTNFNVLKTRAEELAAELDK